MKMCMIVLLLVGVSASFAMPTTAGPKPSMKDAVRMLLESSQLLQNWGNTVMDASETGLNAANVQTLMASGANARQRFHEVVQQVSEMMKENGAEGAPETFDKDIAEIAVDMLKEETKQDEFTEDEKLALIAGDKLAVDTMRLRANTNLFTRSMEVLDASVSDLEDLLTEEVMETDIMEVLPELFEELGSEGTALSILFKAIEESFDDAAELMEPLVEEDMKKEKQGQDTPSRKRRSFPPFNRRLGRGWSVGSGGLSWSNRRGNVHFNARPTFGRGGFGGRVGIRIEF